LLLSALDEHYIYVSDPVRIAAYETAVAAVVRAGSVVVDLGSGTGVLGLLACRAGARKVYSIEATAILELARRIAVDNGCADRIEFLRGSSKSVCLPEPADVILCDQVGPFGFESGLLDELPDARRRFLKPGGGAVPGRLRLYVAPATCPEVYEPLQFWNTPAGGMNFRAAGVAAVNSPRFEQASAVKLLGEPAEAGEIDLTAAEARSVHLSASLAVRRPGLLHGIAGWFEVELAPGVRMTNSPLCPNRIQRAIMLLPLEQAVPVSENAPLDVVIDYISRPQILTWRVRFPSREGDPAQLTQSTWRALLANSAEMGLGRPEATPKLTPHSRARLAIMQWCDGQTPVRDIEIRLAGCFPALFHSSAEVQSFVRDVLCESCE
jgi:protein arginine N-methyltransferase 1